MRGPDQEPIQQREADHEEASAESQDLADFFSAHEAGFPPIPSSVEVSNMEDLPPQVLDAIAKHRKEVDELGVTR